MKSRLLLFFLFTFPAIVFGQNLIIQASITDVTCNGGNNGEITLTITPSAPNAVAPYNVRLFYVDAFGGQTQLANQPSTASTSIVFRTGNGSLNVVGAESFGIPANGAGEFYRIDVAAAGSGSFPQKNKTLPTITVSEPPILAVSVNSLDSDCNAATGGANADGAIDITITGGVGSYNVSWPTTPPSTPISSTTVANGGTLISSNLDGGFYTVTVTDANNCSLTQNISLPISTDPNAGSDLALCGSTTTVLNANAPGSGETGTWSGPLGVSFTDVNSPTAAVSGLSVGVNTLTWTITALGCSGSTDQVEITVNPTPTPTFIAAATSVCEGSTGNVYTTQAGQSNYVWLVSGGGTITAGGSSTDNTVTITWSTAGTQTVSVNYQDALGCSSALPTVSNVTVNALPTPTFTASPLSVCEGSTGNVYSTQAGQSNYVWSISGGGTITAGGSGTDNTVTVTWNTVGAQTVSVNYQDASGCTAVAPTTANVIVNTLPVATITSGPVAVCEGTVGNVYVTQLGQSNYVWSISGGGAITSGGSSTDNTVTVTWNTSGAQTVSVNYQDVSGCSSAVPALSNVTVNPTPTPTFIAAATSVCEGSTGNVYTTQAGQSNYVWLVSGGGTITAGGSSTDNTVTITWSTAGPQTVSVNYQDALGCSSALPTVSNVTVNALPTPTFTASPLSVCEGSTGNVYSTQAGQSNYVWSISGGGTITAGGSGTDNTVTVTWNTVGAQTVSVNYQDASGCTAVAPTTANVIVNTLPVATITSGPVAVCEGTVGNVYVTQLGQSNYVWSISGGGVITSGGSSTDNTVTVTWNTSGAQTVSVNYQDVSGCSSAVPALSNVTVNPTPTPTFIAAATSVCEGSAGNVYTTQAGQSNYVWLVSGGGTITAGGSSTDNTVTITWSTAGPQTVSVNYQDALGCSSALPTVSNVTVNALPTPTFTASPLSLCEGSTGNVYSTQSGQSNYVWSISGGGTITAGGSGTDNTVTVTWNTVGAQTVSVNYQDASGCTAVAPTIANVTVNGLPVATISYPASPFCTTGTATVVRTGTIGGNYSSTSGLSINSFTGTINLAASAPGNYTITYSFTNGICPSTTTTSVTVNPLPTATINYLGGPFCSSGTASVTQTGQAGGTYTSTIGLVIDSSSGLIDLATSAPGTYAVTYLFTDGTCANTATTNVTIDVSPTASISYSGSPFCSTGSAAVVQTGQSGGTYSSTSGLSLNGTSGLINLVASTPGTYTITYTFTNGTCSGTTTTSVTVNALPTATINYLGGPFCSSGTASVTQTGQAGGTYTSTSGLVIDPSSGLINLATSTPGTYTVSYSFTDGTCPNIATTSVTIDLSATASISYVGSPFCATGTVAVVQTGQSGGTYSSTSGLSLNGTSGLINLVASTPGTYTITYTFTNGTCSGTTTTSVTVNALPTATINYLGGPFCSSGTASVTQTGQAGGTYTSTSGLVIDPSSGLINLATSTPGTYTVSYSFTDGTCPNIATTSVTIDLSATASISYVGSPFCATGTVAVVQTGQSGGTYSSTSGLSLNGTSGLINLVASTPGTYTITYTFTNGTCSGTTTTSVTVNALPTATINYLGGPFCSSGTASVTQTGQAGGTYTSTSGLVIDPSSGLINLATSTPGTYTVSYSFTDGTCPNIATTSVTIDLSATASISYSGSPFCSTGSAAVVQTGQSGGTYSSTSGLSLNGTSGLINLVASTPGTYTITYTFTNGTCSGTTTTSVTVNALPTATINYLGGPFCSSGTASVTQTGQAGGTYTSTSGLVIDPSSGLINLATSTPGTYTVSYSFTDGTCPNIATTSVTIDLSATASISYVGSPFCATGTVAVVQTGQSGGTYSSTPGLSLNSTSGLINLAASTPGTYTITYTFTNGTCSGTTTTSVTVNPVPTATIDYFGGPFCATGTASVTQTGQAGGTYTSSSGLVIDSSSGLINLAASTPDNYLVTYAFTNGACLGTVSTSVTIDGAPVASISYVGSPFCATGTASVTQTGQTGGIYTAAVGLVIDSSSGLIDLVTSTPGSYTVTYTFSNGTCPTVTTTTSVVVNALPTATINYLGSPFCATGTVSVTQTGQTGGIYTSTIGLVIDSSTGLIDLVASTAGSYLVTYTFSNGTCSGVAATANVLINAVPTATINYAGSPFCATGTASVTQTGQAGGTYSSTTGLVIDASSGLIDLATSTPGTYTVTYTFTDGTCPNTATSDVTIVAPPTASINYSGAPFCATGTAAVTQIGQTGGTYTSTSGLVIDSSSGLIDLVASAPGSYVVTYTFSNGTCPSNTVTANVLINALPTATISYSGSSFCATGSAAVTQTGQTGGTYTSTAGLVINSSSGLIDLSTSAPGTYTITYTFTDGTCTNSTTSSITINALPTATISYSGTPFCATGSAAVTQTGQTGGTYTSTVGLVINSSSGLIDLSTSAPGTYTITYTFTDGTCPNTATSDVTIVAPPTASINYSGAPFCATGTAAVTQIGQTGGTYTSTSGLVIDSSSGLIDLVASASGSYVVTYTFSNGTCPSNTATANVLINALPTATISYSGSPFCATGTASVTQTGQAGGTYSSTTGLVIDASSGLIDLATSTPGTYTITYTFTDGTCPNTATSDVTIVAPPTASINYSGAPFCATGTAAVTQTGQTGGTYTSTSGLVIDSSSGLIDLVASAPGSYVVTYTFSNGTCPSNTATANVLINVLPTATISYSGSPFCATGSAAVTQTGQTGGTYTSTVGLVINSSSGLIDLSTSAPGTYTITYTFTDGTCPNTATSDVTIVAPPTASINYSGAPFCATGTAAVTQIGQTGGTYTSTSGLVIDSSSGLIDLVASASGSYVVTYTFSNGACPSNTATANVLINALPTATISYSGSPFCATGTASVTQTGQAGGTYSSTTGLVIDASSGLIDLATSTPGTYTITYTFTDGTCPNTATSDVTIVAPPTASINYSGAPFCATGTAAVTQIGQTGGTYTSTSGLVIDSSSGLIDLVASAPGSYVVTYTFSNGTCPNNTATASVLINALPTATISYSGSPFCATGSAAVTQTGQTGGTYTSTVGLSIDTTSGLINLGSSAVGTYLVTYLFFDGTCSNSTTASVTIRPLPTVTLSASSTSICSGSSTSLNFVFTGSPSWTFSYNDGTTNFGPITIPVNLSIPVSPTSTTTYTIISLSDANCTGTNLGSPVTITVDSPPSNSLTVTAALTPLCVGGITTIDVANSQAGVSYQLRNGTTPIGTPVVGNGSTISLSTGVLNTTTTFNVLATRGVCTPVPLVATATVTVAGSINSSLAVTPTLSTVCSGAATTIQVANSENFVNYQLRDNSNNALIGSPIAGDGSAILLPTGNLSSNTTFNVLAFSASCSIQLTNLASINVGITPNASLVVGSSLSPVCVGGVSAITVASSELGVSYQLRDNSNTPIGAAVAGTGGTLNLSTGSLAVTTTFNVLATGSASCPSVQLSTTPTIVVGGTINASVGVVPQSATICSGASTNIQVSNSEIGVNYQLVNNSSGANVGGIVPGDGLTIDLPTGNLIATSTFNVLASNGSCSIQLTTLATVNVSTSPNLSLSTSASVSPVCAGGSSSIQVTGSELGVTYQLRDALNANVGSSVAGTGSVISLPTGALVTAATFNVFASTTSCGSGQLINSVTVAVGTGTINAALTIAPQASSICTGTATFIQVSNSEVGVSYQLVNSGTGVLIGSPVAGNSGTANLNTQSLSATTTFNVIASSGTCSVQMTTSPTVTVTNLPNAALSLTPQSAAICTSTATNIQVANSELGVSYQLRNNSSGVSIGSPVVGTGSTILLPTGNLTATTTFNVLASIGSCSASLTSTPTVTVLLATDPLCAGSCPALTTSNTTICPAGGSVDLTTLVSASVGGGTFTFTGTGVTGNTFNPSGSAGTVVAISVTYTLSGCPNATGTINATVRLSTDPLCSGGGTGNCATVVITPVPSPATCTLSTGGINFNITPAVPAVNITGVIIDIKGVSPTNLTIARTQVNSFNFTALPAGVYDFKIQYGDVSCIKIGQVTVDQSGTVGTPSASNIVAPKCFGQPSGAATISIPGETGNVLQWSLDGGITDPFKSFTAGSQVIGIPAGNQVISVRRNSSDPCFAAVSIVVPLGPDAITAPITTSNATCSNNDGSILVGTVSGGVAPYTFQFDGLPIVGLPINNTFTGLAGGNHVLTVTDANLCNKDFTATITFPGLVNFTVSGSNSSCIALSNGSVTATIQSIGSFQVGISNSQGVQPSTFFDLTSDGTTPFKFDKLAGGTYFVFVRSVGSTCQNVKQQSITNSVSDISVSSTVSTACSGANGAITINSVGGGSASTYTYSLDGVSFISFPPSNTFSNLAGGDHIFRVTDTGGCFKDFKIVVPVPTAIDFTLVNEPLKCIEDKALIRVSNFKGASTDYTYQVLQQSNVVSSGTISSVNAQQDFIIKDITLAQGNYQLQLQQNQVSINGCASPIISAKPFTISGPSKKLDTLYVIKNISLPDFATGSVAVGITESGKAPYEVRVDLVRPLFTSQGSLQDWTEATRNSQNLRLEVQAKSLFAGEYLLSVRDGFGCVKDFIFNLKADENIFIPNVITPNGDNFNDTFFIRNMPSATQVIIVNRWGREVYKSDDYKNDWDANDTSEGVYYYRIKAGEQVFTGWLEVLRDSR